MDFPLVGPAYAGPIPDLNTQTCVNLYPIPGGPGAKHAAGLLGTPGLTPFAHVGTRPIRGMHAFGANLIAISGDTVYRVAESGVSTPVGQLATAEGPVRMSDNGRVVLIVDGAGGHLWDGNTLSPVTDPDFPAATTVAFVGGWFVLDNPASDGEFMVTRLYATDPADMIDALDYATTEKNPDKLVALATHRGEAWLLGEKTTEVWYPSGEVFPLSPTGGAHILMGCAAPGTVAHTPEAMLWLATGDLGQAQVVMARGRTPEAVSTPAIDQAVSGYARVDDASAYAYAQGGHTFYVITFPSGGATWAYDLTTGLWHRRGGWDGIRYTRHRSHGFAHFSGRHLVGDFATGAIHLIDPEAVTDSGDAIRRERTCPVIWNDRKPLFFRSLEIEFEGGVATGGTPRPQVMLDWSDDGGHRFGPNRQAAIDDTAGERYGRRVRFSRLGSSRARVFRVALSDPVKVAIVGATLEAEAGQ